LSRPKADEPENTSVRLPTHDSKLTKVSIKGDQYPSLAKGNGKNLGISGVGRPVSRPDNIVARGS